MDKTISIILKFVDQASGEMQGAMSKVSKGLKDLINKSKIGSAAFALMFTKISKDAIKAASDFQLFRAAAVALTDTTEAADKFVKSITDIGLQSFFSLGQVQDLSKRILGVSGDVDTSTRAMRILTDTVAATGGQYSELEGATRAWMQTLIKAKPSNEELNRQFNNANIPVLKALAERIHDGTVELKGYSATMSAASGPSKKLSDAFGKASDRLPELSLRVEGAKKRLEELSDAGKEGSSTWVKAQASLASAERQFNTVNGTIGAYNSAVAASTQNTRTYKKSVDEILSDLQNIADLNVTGKDTAMAVLDALEQTYGGTTAKMTETYAFQIQKVQEQFTVMAREVLGLQENGEVRQGSVFYYLTQGLIKLNEILPTVTEKMGQFFDFILSNRTALITAIGVLTGMFAGLALITIELWGPVVAVGAAFGAVAFAVARLIDFIEKHDLVSKFMEIKDAVVEWAKGIPEAIGNMVTSVIEWFKMLPTRIIEFLGNLFFEWIPYAVGFMVGFFIGHMAKMVQDAIMWLEKLPERTMEFFQNMWDTITTKGVEMRTSLGEELSSWPGRVSEWFKDLPQKMKDAAQAAQDAFMGVVDDWIDKWFGRAKALLEIAKQVGEVIGRVFRSAASGEEAGIQAGLEMPQFQHGGIVPGTPNEAVPILAHGGERVIPRSGTDVGGMSGGSGLTINITGPVSMDSEDRVRELADRINRVQGRQNELARFGVGY